MLPFITINFAESLKAKVIRRAPPKAIATQTTPDLLGVGEPQTSSQEAQRDVKKSAKKSEEDIFRCPCGQCSLDQYLDEGCPKSSSKQFPYLNVGNLDEGDKEDLMFILSQDVTDMIKSFAQLTNETRNSLNKRGVSVQDLVAHTLSLGAYDSQAMQKPLLSEDTDRLQQAETVHGVFIILQPHMSFFNHELLKHITDSKELCTDDDRKRMENYCSKFNKFCRRKIFEVPPPAFGQSIAIVKKSKRKAFAVLITKHEDERNLVFVNEAKHKIASILKLKPSTLHLHRIDEGSIILVFSVPDFVARQIFQLEPLTDAKLRTEGFHIVIPAIIKDYTELSTITKPRRFSWPLGSKEGYAMGDCRKFLLLYSAMKGHVKTIKALLKASMPEILTLRWNGMTALMFAAKHGHTEVVLTLLPTCSQTIVDLECGGMTALMLASKCGHTDTVQVLIDAGANVSAKHKNGITALMMAAQGGHTETVKALIDAGADITCKQRVSSYPGVWRIEEDNGKTALMMAAKRGHTETVKALIEAGADVNIRCKLEGGDAGKTALMMAVEGGHTETVKALVEAGADTNVVCEKWDSGKTALMMAAQGGHTETVKALIEAGANVNATCKQWLGGKTALMMAAQCGHTEIVKALIEAGAEVNAICIQVQADDGKTALRMAVEGGHTETVKALIEAGADTRRLQPESFFDLEPESLHAAATGGNTSYLDLVDFGSPSLTRRLNRIESPPAGNRSDELFYYQRSSSRAGSRAGSMAGSSVGSHCSFG